MLYENFFHLLTEEKTDDSVCFTIEIEPAHPIFQGHFPDVPVVPGACLVQSVLELVAHWQQQETALQKIRNAKFLSVINPLKNNKLIINIKKQHIDESIFSCDVTIFQASALCAKMSLELKNIPA